MKKSFKETKVAFVIVSDNFSGGEHVVKELAKRIANLNGMKVSIFCNENLRKHYSGLINVNVIVAPYVLEQPFLKRLITYIKCSLYLRRHLQTYKYDLLNLNLNSSIFIAAFARILTKQAYCVTLHGDDIREFNNNQTFFYKRLIKPVITSVFNKSKRLITVSSWQVEDLEPRYKTKIIKIPNGVDTKAFKPSKTKNKHIVALYAGRLITTKGIREIVKVANVSPQVDFWFAGTGPLAASLIGSNIKYLGFKDTTELCDLYQQATFCIFPSYFEAFPLVGLEAMSCGKPIICTARGFDEYAKNGFNSIIIKPKDIKSLHKAVMRLSSDSSFCRELSANARLTSGNFDWSKIAKQHYDLYNEIVTESKEDTVTESYQNLNH